MFCNNCGNELSENDKYCNKCGTKVNKDRKTITIKLNQLIVGIILVILIITGIVIFFLNKVNVKR